MKALPRIMLVTSALHATPTGGRELLCKLNHDTLQVLYGDRLRLVELPRARPRGLRQMANAFRGHIDGIDHASLSAALARIESEAVDQVFLDGSNLGEFARAVKAGWPQVEVVTFLHNVEARFFAGAFRQAKSIRALAVLLANYLAERKAVRHSDKLVTLSQRDSLQLQALYGRAATHVVPMALQDQLPAKAGPFPAAGTSPEAIAGAAAGTGARNAAGRYALFVGGVFYANQAGIAWFVEQVVPRIDIRICIVGRGFEGLREVLERDRKVEVIGAVESLAEWYRHAAFVIAPIFDGSGMKTKVAEALMHGRRVIGTPEAFSGYEGIAQQAGVVCSSADEFVAAINAVDANTDAGPEQALRAIYEREYSHHAFRVKIARVLQVSWVGAPAEAGQGLRNGAASMTVDRG